MHSNGQLKEMFTYYIGCNYSSNAYKLKDQFEKDIIDYDSFYDQVIKHREDGPTYQLWYKNGQLAKEEYWIFDKLENKNGSVARCWYEHGQLMNETGYNIGRLYKNMDEYTFREWDKNGNLTSGEYLDNYDFEGFEPDIDEEVLQHHRDIKLMILMDD